MTCVDFFHLPFPRFSCILMGRVEKRKFEDERNHRHRLEGDVGEGENHPGLYRKALKINTDEVHWIRPNPDWKPGASLRCKVRIRYRQPLQEAELKCKENGTYIVFDQAQRAVTPGQFAVWYADDSEMLGSGVINE